MMRKMLQHVFFLVFPFLWKDKTARLATISTLGIILLNTLAQTITPWLLGYLLKHYQTLPRASLLLTVALLLLCWYIHRMLGHLRAIVFFPIINRAIRDIRMRVVMKLHQAPLQSWEQYGVTEILSASTRVSQSIRSFMSVSFVNILPALFKMCNRPRLVYTTNGKDILVRICRKSGRPTSQKKTLAPTDASISGATDTVSDIASSNSYSSQDWGYRWS
jgi:ABC-type multidrug transport system fused ATPase/permease subunit